MASYTLVSLLISIFIYIGSLSKELQFIIAILFIIYNIMFRPNTKIFDAVLIFIPIYAMIAISIIVTIVTSEFGYVSLKTLWYFSRFPVFFAAGVYFFNYLIDLDCFFMGLYMSALFESIDFLIRLKYNIDVNIDDRYAIRSEVGHGSTSAIFALPLILTNLLYISRVSMPRLYFYILTAFITLLATYISDSRTSFVVFLIAICIITCGFPNKIIGYTFVSSVYLIMILFSTPFLYNIFDVNRLQTIVDNLPEFFQEIAPLFRSDAYDINNFWRGYETYITFDYVSRISDMSWLFGAGLNSAVPIPENINLGGNYITDIPIFHNAFSFVYIRSGVFGIMLLLIQYIYFMSYGYNMMKNVSRTPEFRDIINLNYGSRLIFAVVMELLLTTPTTTGMFNFDTGGSTPAIILGILFAFSANSNRSSIANESILSVPIEI